MAKNLGIDRKMLGRSVKEFQDDENEAFRGNGKQAAKQPLRIIQHYAGLSHMLLKQ